MLEANLTNPRQIGCEYECFMVLTGSGTQLDAMRSIANVLTANGIRADCRGYSHAPIPQGIDVMIEQDSSIHPDSRFTGVSHVPIEAKTRILSGVADFDRVVPKTLDILRYMGCRTNTSTGHHVHVGFPEIRQDCRHVRSLWNLLHRFEPVLFSLCAPSRRNGNTYCRPMPNISKLLHHCRTPECFERALASYDRYQACNFTHLWHNDGGERVEFRHFGGTLDSVKARHWIKLLLQIVEHSIMRSCQASPTQVPGSKAGLHKLLTTCGLKVNTRVYAKVCPELRSTGHWLLGRWNRLNGPAAGRQTPRPESES